MQGELHHYGVCMTTWLIPSKSLFALNAWVILLSFYLALQIRCFTCLQQQGIIIMPKQYAYNVQMTKTYEKESAEEITIISSFKENGNRVVRYSSNEWSGIWSDLTIEQI